VISEEKAIDFTVNIQSSPIYVNCDRAWMETAISNLLDNALKFTPAGCQIDIGANQTERKIHIWAHDTGLGIPADELQFIFDRFYRGLNSEEKGSGLGLSIVQSVVQAHGGSVSVKSTIDEGSTITIELPASS
jgi:signal transduction histidine kinase